MHNKDVDSVDKRKNGAIKEAKPGVEPLFRNTYAANDQVTVLHISKRYEQVLPLPKCRLHLRL